MGTKTCPKCYTGAVGPVCHKHASPGTQPDWFGPALTEAMRKDFEAHVEGCTICQASSGPEALCDDGKRWAKDLGLLKEPDAG